MAMPAPPAVGIAARRVHRTGRAAEGIAAVQQAEQRRLVRDGEPEPVDVAGAHRTAHETFERRWRHLHRHQHRIDAMAREKVVVELGRTHLGDRVAEDQKDACAAGDVHVASGLCCRWTNDRQRQGSPQGASHRFAR
jgi:hypothetical protein